MYVTSGMGGLAGLWDQAVTSGMGAGGLAVIWDQAVT